MQIDRIRYAYLIFEVHSKFFFQQFLWVFVVFRVKELVNSNTNLL